MLLTELQTWILLAASCIAVTLSVWAVFVIIPNRNETIEFLKDRNQTLEYWVRDITIEHIPAPWIPLSGSAAHIRLDQLLLEHRFLNDKLRKCLTAIEQCNQVIEKEKTSTSEQS